MNTDFVALDLHEPPAVVAKATAQALAPTPPIARHHEHKAIDPRFPHIRFLKNHGSLLRDLHDMIGPQVAGLVPTIAVMAGAVPPNGMVVIASLDCKLDCHNKPQMWDAEPKPACAMFNLPALARM